MLLRPAGGHPVGHRYYPPLGPCPRRSVNRYGLVCYLLATPRLSLAGILYVTIAQDHHPSYRLPTTRLSLTAPKPNPSNRPHPDLSSIRVQKRSSTPSHKPKLSVLLSTSSYHPRPKHRPHALSTPVIDIPSMGLSTHRAWGPEVPPRALMPGWCLERASGSGEGGI